MPEGNWRCLHTGGKLLNSFQKGISLPLPHRRPYTFLKTWRKVAKHYKLSRNNKRKSYSVIAGKWVKGYWQQQKSFKDSYIIKAHRSMGNSPQKLSTRSALCRLESVLSRVLMVWEYLSVVSIVYIYVGNGGSPESVKSWVKVCCCHKPTMSKTLASTHGKMARPLPASHTRLRRMAKPSSCPHTDFDSMFKCPP